MRSQQCDQFDKSSDHSANHQTGHERTNHNLRGFHTSENSGDNRQTACQQTYRFPPGLKLSIARVLFHDRVPLSDNSLLSLLSEMLIT